jgi:hypothetical protein
MARLKLYRLSLAFRGKDMMNFHWWYAESIVKGLEEAAKRHPEWGKVEPWIVEVDLNGKKEVLEASEWTLRDPSDGWKPAEDAVYVGYGHLVSTDGGMSVEDKEKEIFALAKQLYPTLTGFDANGVALY